MKKFLEDLKKELHKLKMSNTDIEEIINDHKEMIEEALSQGLSEEELAKKFGNPERVAQDLFNDSKNEEVEMDKYIENNQYEAIEGYKIFRVLPVNELNEIIVKLVSEDVKMNPYDGENIEIHYRKNIKEEDYEVSLENGSFMLSRISKPVGLFNSKESTNFVIRYPNVGELQRYVVETVSGDCELKGIEAVSVKLKSTSGDFEIKGVKSKDCDFANVSGDYEFVDGKCEDAKLSTVSGDYECKDLIFTGDIVANTVSGDFEFFNVTANDVDFKTVSGDLEGKEFYMNRIDLKSVSGDIKIENSDKSRNIIVGKKSTLSGDIKIR